MRWYDTLKSFLGLLAAGALWVCGKVRISKPVDYTMLQWGVRPPHWEGPSLGPSLDFLCPHHDCHSMNVREDRDQD